jgi:hypothetical protein
MYRAKEWKGIEGMEVEKNYKVFVYCLLEGNKKTVLG